MSVSFRAQGKKRDFTEDETASVVCLKKSRYTPPLNNKFHLQGCDANRVGLLIAVREMYPTINEQLVAQVLESCGENVEAAVEKLEQLKLSGNGGGSRLEDPVQEGSSSMPPPEQKIHEQWMGPFLQELTQAKDPEDVKLRLGRLLAAYEDAVLENFKQNSEEIKSVKKEFELLKKNNTILAQAVALQHEKLKQNSAKDEDLEKLKLTVVQYEDRVRNLELANYTLTMHLQQAVGHKYQEQGPPDIC